MENKKEQPCAAFYNLRKYYLYPKRIRKKEKMKSTKEIRNRESLRYFKIVENFLNSESAITELSKIIEEFNIPRKLSIFQDVFEVDYDGDYKYGDIPKYKYTNLFKYLKENLPEINEFIPGTQYSGDQHVGVMKTCDNIRAYRSINVIVSKIADELKLVSVSFDINKSKLLLSKKYNNNLNNRLEINFEKNTGKFNLNILPLFDLEILVRPFIDVISDQQTVSLAFLQYIAGIIDSEKLSTYIVSEIKFNLSEIVTNFTIGEDQVDLSKYPANFYTEEEIHSIFFGSDVNFKSIIRGAIPSFLDSLKSNDKIRRVLLSEHQLNNISVDMLHYFIKTDYYDLIPWYLDLNRESRLKLLFNTFDDIEENSNANTIPIDVITKILTDDELFSIAKKYYKNLLNSLLTGKHTKAAQDYSCIELSLNELTKKVKINGHKFHLRITEEQLSELKSELLPLLKQAQNLFVYKDINLGFDLLNPKNTFKNSKKFFPLLIREYSDCAFSNLFELFDWYPQIYNFLTECSDADSIVNNFEKISVLKRLQESTDYEIEHSFVLKKYSNGRDWFSDKEDIIEEVIKDVCEKDFFLLTEDDSEYYKEEFESLKSRLEITTKIPKFSFNLK